MTGLSAPLFELRSGETWRAPVHHALAERRRTEPGNDIVSNLVQRGDDNSSITRILGFAFTAVEELLARCPDFAVDVERGCYGVESYVRRQNALPWVAC